MKKILSFLNGKKTAIGMGLMLIAQGLKVFFPEVLNGDQIDYIETIGLIIGGGGLLHKGAKAKLTKQK